MKMLTNIKECGIEPFAFAGFAFPKFVWNLPHGSFKKRIEYMRHPVTGGYYHAPKPGSTGQGFYLESDGMPDLRWRWADEVTNQIRHTGWFTDEYGDGDKIRGVVFRLAHNRGFLAGWSMGEGMASTLEYHIYDDEEEAALDADSMAESAAENAREEEAAYRTEYDDE
jgi:hypothetical protein